MAYHPDLERLIQEISVNYMIRILSRSRAVTISDPRVAGQNRRDATTQVVIMLDGRERSSGRPVRGRGWLAHQLRDVRKEDLKAVLARALEDCERVWTPWPWQGSGIALPVVFAPGVGGTAFHEVVGHALEADPSQPPIGIGTQLATGPVTVIDDPTLPGLWGSRRVDDQGATSVPTMLLDNGTVRTLLHARETSSYSSSARRMDYRCRPLARMSNTYLAAGSEDPRSLMDGEAVLYCLEGGSAEVRPGSQDIDMRIRAAELWRQGTPIGLHRDLTLHFSSNDLLHGIEGVAADLSFRPGRCVKESQAIPVSHGAPTFRLAGALVTSCGD